MAQTWRIPADLPAGIFVTPLRDDHVGDPVLWVTSEPVPDAGQHWGKLHPHCVTQGLWPLVLTALDGEPWAPWHDGELDPVSPEEMSLADAGIVLADLWHAMAQTEVVDDDLVDTPGAWRDARVELGLPETWSGLAPASEPTGIDPEQYAATVSARVFHDGLIGLVPATTGSAALATLGWDGAQSHTGTADVAVVFRSWEERFGARLIGLGFDTAELSVAAPPTTLEHARQVAAEHFALCPDNIAQGTEDFDLYASHLVGAGTWSFWWD